MRHHASTVNPACDLIICVLNHASHIGLGNPKFFQLIGKYKEELPSAVGM
jgi:hypothetical protein